MTELLGEHRRLRADAPPEASEDIHLPGPSYLPVIVAVGITLALVGVLVSALVFVAGMIVWVVAAVIWIRDARSDIAELPLDRG